MRLWLLCAAAPLLVGQALPPTAVPSASATAILAAARQAAGGEGVLTAVTAFDVKGTRTRALGTIETTESVEFACSLPDRFVQVTDRQSSSPLGTTSSRSRHGFSGDDLIAEETTVSPLPPPIVATRQPTTAQEIAARQARQVAAAKQTFVTIVTPLFASSFPRYPLAFASAGSSGGPTGPAEAVEAKGPDGFTWHLFFDASTHRLTGLSWMAKPVITMTAHTTMAVSGGRAMSAGPPPVLPADPTAGMADVVWQMTIGDYRVADGLTWPHRFTTTVNGRKAEDLKLLPYKINPKLDAGLFKVVK